MPVIIVLVVLAVAAVCAAAFFAVRAYKHRRFAEQLDKRDDDQVHYAFVINPSKPQAEQRKQHIQEFCEAKHLTQIEYIETQLDKDGRACALEALEHGADVVVAVGGDGTVRTVASALSGTGHALGIIPIGTGNLFARNMLAYFVSGVKNLFAPKYKGDVTITSADGSTHTTHGLTFRTFMAGNCGQIPVFSLMPDAVYDDGILDYEIIDTSGGLIGWANLFGDVLHQTITGKAQQSPFSTNSTVDQIQGVSADIKLEKPVLAQVDGDMLPETQHIRFSVERKSLCVRVPEAPEANTTSVNQ